MLTAAQIADIKLKYETHGFCHLRGVMPEDFIARLRSAFDTASARHIDEWRRHAAAGTGERSFFDIPDLLAQDDLFIDLADHPAVLPLLTELVGQDIQLHQTAARLFPPGPTFTSPFHSDITRVAGISHENMPSFLVKIHFFIEDLTPDQGCLAFIPGSQQYPASRPNPKNLDPNDPDLVVRIVPRAGDVVIFNTHVLHMAMDNASERVRKSIIYTYSHFWLKQHRSAIPEQPERFADNRQRKQLFGLPDGATSMFARRLTAPPREPLFDTVIQGAKQVARRLLR